VRLPDHVVQPAGYALGDGPIVMRQLIRPETEGRQHGGIRAISNVIRQSLAEINVHQCERAALLPQVGTVKRRSPKRTQDLANRVLGQFR
jgi:hypothetical protein